MLPGRVRKLRGGFRLGLAVQFAKQPHYLYIYHCVTDRIRQVIEMRLRRDYLIETLVFVCRKAIPEPR